MIVCEDAAGPDPSPATVAAVVASAGEALAATGAVLPGITTEIVQMMMNIAVDAVNGITTRKRLSLKFNRRMSDTWWAKGVRRSIA